mgnify:CR=1 FL=1
MFIDIKPAMINSIRMSWDGDPINDSGIFNRKIINPVRISAIGNHSINHRIRFCLIILLSKHNVDNLAIYYENQRILIFLSHFNMPRLYSAPFIREIATRLYNLILSVRFVIDVFSQHKILKYFSYNLLYLVPYILYHGLGSSI